MRAVSSTVGAEEGAVRALEAGADGLCLGHDLGPESVHAAVVDAVRTGRLSEDRVGEAASRVAQLGSVAVERHVDGASRRVGLDAARRAVLCVGEVRLAQPPLVVDLLPAPSIAAGNTNHRLADVLTWATTLRLREAPLDARSLLAEHRGRQLVVVVQDAHRDPGQRVAASTLLEAAADGVLVEVGVPGWRPEGIGYIATHGRGRVNLEAAAERLQPS
jgi:beta-N-acetylhexosaminidase